MVGKLLIILFTINTAFSQIFMKQAVKILGSPSSIEDMPSYMVEAVRSPWIWAAFVLQVLSYLVWIVVLSREKLGVAVALSGSLFCLIMAAVAWTMYDETLTAPQWAGIAFVVTGVTLLGFKSA